MIETYTEENGSIDIFLEWGIELYHLVMQIEFSAVRKNLRYSAALIYCTHDQHQAFNPEVQWGEIGRSLMMRKTLYEPLSALQPRKSHKKILISSAAAEVLDAGGVNTPLKYLEWNSSVGGKSYQRM
ncbi:hypothetical protein N7471_007842 [Penicillium samsonianum]|uniref:uncharacterized protein n=1 Tax=Penicillium samsonianum TaxID=1882272 RepID=UPI0025468272|nr:uncharacterized protein N7471_007842 [Penicillium samsonianum]KAJ6132627.1 hypothetical protein N7471_007842 [Penicillium samsonianum]